MQTGVLYLRYSAQKQREQSIEGQRRDCLAYAEREGITIVGEYVDRAKSAQFDDRPEFQRMIADSARRAFNLVIVWKLDRFARNRRDAANTRYKLRMNGVKLVSAMESISDSPEGIILEAVLEAQAEYYSKNLSQNVKRGMRESLNKGNFLGGNVPYGFRVEGTRLNNDKIIDKKLVIDEERAPVIRKLFSDYAAGKSKRQIVDEMNARGITSHGGKRVSFNSFQHVLKNVKYIGKIEYAGQSIDNYCPAIVDEATFYKVQEKLTVNKRDSGKQKAIVRYLLSSKCFCGFCGSKMVGVSGTSKMNAVHSYYACPNWRKHTCKKKAERKSFLESYVVEQTVEYILRPDRLKLICERIVEGYNREFSNDKLKDIDSQIRKVERELDKLTDEYLSADLPAFKKRINERAEQADNRLNDLQTERAKMLVSVKKPLTEKEVAVWLKIFTDGDAADPAFQERVIDIFVNSVYLYDDKVLIYFNIKDSKQTCHIEHIADMDELIAVIENTASGGSYDKPHGSPTV